MDKNVSKQEISLEGEVVNNNLDPEVGSTTSNKSSSEDLLNYKNAAYLSLILSILGVVTVPCGGFCCLPFPILGAIVGWYGTKSPKEDEVNLAKIGLGISLVTIALVVLCTVCMVLFYGTAIVAELGRGAVYNSI